MPSPEILTLLCAGSTRYHPAGGRGRPLLSRLEVAGLLAGLPPDAVSFAQAKYCGCEDAERLLIGYVRAWAAGLAAARQWEVVRGRPVVCNMAALAVFEAVRPNRCGTCHGTGFRGARACPTCNGLGVAKLRGTEVAAACGVEYQDYYRQWRGRYELIYRHVADFEGQVNGVLRVAVDMS